MGPKEFNKHLIDKIEAISGVEIEKEDNKERKENGKKPIIYFEFCKENFSEKDVEIKKVNNHHIEIYSNVIKKLNSFEVSDGSTFYLTDQTQIIFYKKIPS